MNPLTYLKGLLYLGVGALCMGFLFWLISLDSMPKPHVLLALVAFYLGPGLVARGIFVLFFQKDQ